MEYRCTKSMAQSISVAVNRMTVNRSPLSPQICPYAYVRSSIVCSDFHRLGILVKLRGTLQLGSEAVDNTWNKGVTLATWLRAFLQRCVSPPVSFLLFFPRFMLVCHYVPHPSLTLSASPSVPACRYIPSPLAAFAVPGGERVWRKG